MNRNQTWETIHKKYPEDRDEMTLEREEAFVEECFDAFEEEGFSKVFWSPFGDHQEQFQKPFTVIGRCTTEQTDLSVLPMWDIRFEDGTTFGAYPEEIIVSSMIGNGCRINPDLLRGSC